MKNKSISLFFAVTFFTLFLLTSGCVTPPQVQIPSTPETSEIPATPGQKYPDTYTKHPKEKPIKIPSAIGDQWPIDRQTISTALTEMLDDWGEPAFEVDEELVRHVSYFYKYYSVKEYERSNRAIERSKEYLPNIIESFRACKLPEEIAFAVPFVESSFNPKAQSGVGAVGMFQFMKDTAKTYGLNVTRSNDERLDVYKAAPACAKYLRNNRNVFASIVLSLGSYHHGTGKVSQVLLTAANQEERNFTSIFNNPRLGKYSKEYIPQCLSAALIYRFMKELGIENLPEIVFQSRIIAQTLPVNSLEKSVPGLYAMNPDLTSEVSTYHYVSTNGYVLLSNVKIGNLNTIISAKSTKSLEPDFSRKVQPAYTTETETDIEQVSYKGTGKLSVKSSGSLKVSGVPKYIRYVFQEGNGLAAIADIFGTSPSQIKKSPQNRYLLKRKARPGDIIRIDNLSPTTQKLGGGGYVCGNQMDLKTQSGETLGSLCNRVKNTVRKHCQNSQWEMGTDITPELIGYWNKEDLKDATPNSQLRAGIDLVVYTDYLWDKDKKGSVSGNRAASRNVSHSSSDHVGTAKKGTKYITYLVQDKNIKQGDILNKLSTIFQVKSGDLLKWNSWLGSNTDRLLGKQKIVIKNRPDSVQKFGNPGTLCGTTGDTRFVMKKGQTLNDIAENAIDRIRSCNGHGKGVSPENILYWNADILQKVGIKNIDDQAEKSVKLIIYADYY